MKRIILDKELLYKKYYVESKTMEKVAEELCVSTHVIRRNMEDYSFKIRSNKKPYLKKDQLVDLYCDKKMSIREVAKKMGVADTIVRKSLYYHEIPRRNKSWKSSLSKNGKDVPCLFCGKIIYRKKSTLEKFDKFFCSWDCSKEYQSISKKILPDKWRSRRDYKNWRSQVKIRDDKKCRLCGSKKKIVTHHIIEAQKKSKS